MTNLTYYVVLTQCQTLHQVRISRLYQVDHRKHDNTLTSNINRIINILVFKIKYGYKME